METYRLLFGLLDQVTAAQGFAPAAEKSGPEMKHLVSALAELRESLNNAILQTHHSFEEREWHEDR